ncbi:MAG: DUF2853 family protein [Saprospiraceae bacterium]
MSKFDDVIAKCAADLTEMGGYDANLLNAVAKGLGPSIYNDDSKLVAASDKAELDRVKQNFLIKKLGLADSPALDEAIAKVAATYNKRQKQRPVFYYLLVKELGQEKAYQ